MGIFWTVAVVTLITVSVQTFNYNELYQHNVDYTHLFNDKTIHFSVNCLLDKVPCEEYQPHKEWFPFIAKSDCAFCNPIQRRRFNSTKYYIKEKYPHYYKALEDKYVKE